MPAAVAGEAQWFNVAERALIMGSMPRRDFIKLALLGAGMLATEGCVMRRHEGAAPAASRFLSSLRKKEPAAVRDFNEALRRAMRGGVGQGGVPGAVACVRHRGKPVYHEAFGAACLAPAEILANGAAKDAPGSDAVATAMRPETRFDLASLTKVVATTTSILILRDEGRIDLDATLTTYLPQLAASDKKDLTIRQLMTHTAGLPPFKLYYKTLRGKEAYLKAIAAEPLTGKPGEKWVYSDLGFILLGFVVESVSGKPLDIFTQERIFKPLGMKQTGYIPVGPEGRKESTRRLLKEFAATEVCPWRKRLMVGAVHDENAYAEGGVSGHAGLFSTAADLSRFGQMLLNKGELDGVRILAPESVALMNRPQIPRVMATQGLGWRLPTSLESTLGFLGSSRSFGHTGFTGTTLWLDPDNQVLAVLLTNAVHPSRAKSRSAPLRRSFHGAVMEQLKQTPASVKSGLDVLEAENFARLRGKRIAVVTNPTAVNRQGTHLLDLLAKQPEVQVTAIFGPEHGFAGDEAAGKKVGDSAHGKIPVYSLYGKRRKPTAEMAKTFDVVLFDIQDVGARFYTYIWTLFTIEQFCAESGKKLIVLDRPNPLGGRLVEGPLLEPAQASGVGMKPIPTRYGLTIGELALLYNQQGWLGEGLKANVEVVALENWRREMRFHQTGLPWIAPSPNIPTWDTAAVYPGTCIFEGTRWSEGRGTDVPFQMVGGPGLDSHRLAQALNAMKLPGCHFIPADFTPRSVPAAPDAKLKGQRCGGVFIRVDDHEAFRPIKTGLAVLMAMRAQASDRFQWIASMFDRLIGNSTVRKQIEAGATLEEITAPWAKDAEQFEPARRKAMIYA